MNAKCPHRLVGLSTWFPASELLWKTVKPLLALLKKMNHLNFYGLVPVLSTLRFLTVIQCDQLPMLLPGCLSSSQKD